MRYNILALALWIKKGEKTKKREGGRSWGRKKRKNGNGERGERRDIRREERRREEGIQGKKGWERGRQAGREKE